MSEIIKEIFSTRRYKSAQGKMARRLTMIAAALFFFAGAYTLYLHLPASLFVRGVSAMLIGAVGFWLSYRAVNFPAFADFLVSVEAEMMKVSWPSRNELYVSTIVVLIVLGLLAVLIYAFDILWYGVFHWFLPII
ncbi:MAG: preprotein translocase subunit SecE [Thermoguttaceae bacterium]